MSHDFRPHVDQVLVRFSERSSVHLIHAGRSELFDDGESIVDQREIVEVHVAWIFEALFV